MQPITPYLNFNGNARQAMEFYNTIFGGKLDIMTFEGMENNMSVADKTRVMHAVLTTGDLILMASDVVDEHKMTFGTAVQLSINCESVEQIDRLHAQIAEGGTVTMPVQDTFWGARFGMASDKFGIYWMFNFDYPKEEK